ncbi:MAG: hypothetical protein KDC92_05645 [Bacteroidetes bacterium]|nr:hypothetical protein [Bacteroidota bacterium]
MPDAFMQEFEEFILSYKNKPLKTEFTTFKENWDAGNLGSGAEEAIMYSADVMIKKRFKQVPDFLQFLEAINSFAANNIDEGTLIDFCQVSDTLIATKTSKTDLQKYYKFIVDINECHCFTGAKSGNSWKGDFLGYDLGMAKEPFVAVNGIKLQLDGGADSLSINGTDGKFYIFKKLWVGKGGVVDWLRTDLDPSNVYAELNNYRIDMKLIEYKADSVTFYNTSELDKPVQGRLKDRIHNNGADGPFPEFRSYASTFKLNNIEDYLEYEGGFGMAGRSILGSGTDSTKAVLWIKRDGKRFIKLEADAFTITPLVVRSQLAAVTIDKDFDSIYHPGYYCKITRDTRLVELGINPETKVKSPMFNSYHSVDMYVDKIEWQMDSNFMEVKSAYDPEGLAFFESSNYFSQRRFDAVRGALSYQPLERMEQLVQSYGRDLTEDDVLSHFNSKDIALLQPLLAKLHSEGFITYHVSQKRIVVQDKLFDYLAAWRKQIDYDVIQLVSRAKGKSNSKLNLDNFDLEIYGIKRVKLSDSQSVEIFPYEQTVTLKKNRDMAFNGYVKAGRFEFFGNDFNFNYEDFTINLNATDSMMFNFPDKRLENRLRKVNTVIQDVTGVLKIDKPDNKSGKKPAPAYPIFDCTKEAYVYYDYASVYGGVYDRERFNFSLKPFVVDSLDNFALKGIVLLGTFKSADILPTFDHELSLQPDFSLGFQKYTPDQGYPLYKGKGQCFMKIDLSNRGLRGEGNFTFNGSDVQSAEMLFFPDSMIALNTTFIMKDHPKKKFPDVTSEKATVTWSPYQDTMKIAAIDSLSFINMYEKESFLKGALIFTKENMFGNGEFNYKHSIVSSDYFDFKNRKLLADSSYFKLNDLENVRTVLTNESSEVSIDFDKQVLIGKSKSDSIFTNLPINQYSTNVPKYRWDYNEKMLYLEPDQSNQEDIDYFFVSTNPNYDSLTFTPQEAKLSLETYSIEVYNIKYITVADAQVRPDSSITIGEDGGLPMLNNAEIVATKDNEYHHIKNAEVNIFSSKKLSAFGDYQYTDKDGKLWQIHMDNIYTTDSFTTVGTGKIPDSANFYFGPRMRYKGDITFLSVRKPLEFKGELAIEHPFEDELSTERLRYEGLVAFDSLYLDMSEPKNVYGEALYSGMFMNTRTNQIYHRFLGKMANPDDWPIYAAKGYLYYVADSSTFIIAPERKIFEEDIRDPQWKFCVLDSSLFGEGPIGFNYEWDNFKLSLSALFSHDFKSGKTDIKATGGVNFPFLEDGLKIMGDSMINYGYFAEDVLNDKDFIIAAAARPFDKDRDVQRAINSIVNNGTILTSKEYKPIFHFSEMTLKWDTASKAFMNVGKVALGNVGNAQVNKWLNARIVLSKRFEHDSVSIYIESNAGNWYLFNFDDNILQFAGSDAEYIKRATSSKLKDIEGEYSMKLSDEFTILETRQKIIR